MEKLPTSSKALRYLPFLVASAFFMQMLDATILNTAIPTIARSFNSHPLQLHSLVTAYMLTVCVLIPASGWISDKLGSRRTFLLAISVFSVGSLLCALSASVTMMTVCRVIQGIGGAFLMPVGRLVILRSYPRSMFVNVLNIVTIPALLGPLLGPVLGGIIVQYASWHWIFLINIPVGMAGLWATWKLMPNLKAVREQKFDWPGFFLFSSSAVLATMGLSSAGGITDKPRMVILTSAGGILQLLYWVLAFRSKAPIFSPALFRIRNFAIGIAGNIVCRLGGSCLPYLMPLFFQVVLGYSALQSGMSLIPLALSNLLAKTVAPRLLGKFGYRNIMVVNTFTIGSLLASFRFVGPGTHELILLGMLALLGGANSIQFTCMNTLTLIDLPNADASSGNSLLSTIMQLSIAVSIAAAPCCWTASAAIRLPPERLWKPPFMPLSPPSAPLPRPVPSSSPWWTKTRESPANGEKQLEEENSRPCSGTGRGISRLKRTALRKPGAGLFQGNRFLILPQGYINQLRLCNFGNVIAKLRQTFRIHLHLHGDGGAAHLDNIRIKGHYIAHQHRSFKRQAAHRTRHNIAAQCIAHGGIGSRKVHLAHHPAAEYFPALIGIRRHWFHAQGGNAPFRKLGMTICIFHK